MFIFLFIVLVLYITTAYFNLVFTKKDVFKLFKKLDLKLNARYGLAIELSKIINDSNKQEYISKICNHLRVLTNDYKNIDRKLALNIEISSFVKQAIERIKKDNYLQTEYINLIEEYQVLENDISELSIKYNQIAKKLRKYVDIFPTSFIARLVNIKYTDLYKA